MKTSRAVPRLGLSLHIYFSFPSLSFSLSLALFPCFPSFFSFQSEFSDYYIRYSDSERRRTTLLERVQFLQSQTMSIEVGQHLLVLNVDGMKRRPDLEEARMERVHLPTDPIALPVVRRSTGRLHHYLLRLRFSLSLRLCRSLLRLLLLVIGDDDRAGLARSRLRRRSGRFATSLAISSAQPITGPDLPLVKGTTTSTVVRFLAPLLPCAQLHFALSR